MLRRFWFILFFLLAVVNIARADENLTLDPDHAYVVWSVSHFGFSNVTGKFIANGTLLLDEQSPQLSKLTVTIMIDSLTTGVAKLDKTLLGRSFFDAKNFPTASFVSEKIDQIDNDSAEIDGVLTIKNISQPVTLQVDLIKDDQHPFYKKQAYGFKASAIIMRSKFNMRGYLPGVSDEVTLSIEAEAIKDFKPRKGVVTDENT